MVPQWIWSSFKALLLGIWSLVLGYFVVSIVEALSPGLWIQPDGFAAAVVGVALLAFPAIWWAFRPQECRESGLQAGASAATAEPPVALDEYNLLSLPEPHHPDSCCPACHAPMQLAARSDGWKLVSKRELFRCPQGHLWWREISVDSPDVNFPWQPCSSTSEGLDALSA